MFGSGGVGGEGGEWMSGLGMGYTNPVCILVVVVWVV